MSENLHGSPGKNSIEVESRANYYQGSSNDSTVSNNSVAEFGSAASVVKEEGEPYPEPLRSLPSQGLNETTALAASQQFQANKRYSLFSKEISKFWILMAKHFSITNLLLVSYCISIFSIFWGALYNRQHYMFKLNLLAVIRDGDFSSSSSSSSSNDLNSALYSMMEASPATWHIYNSTSFIAKYGGDESSIEEKIRELVHHEDYWMSLDVDANLTNTITGSLLNTSAPFNSSNAFRVTYESGRDPTNLKSSVLPQMQSIEAQFVQYYTTTFLPDLVDSLNTSTVYNLIQTSQMSFNYYDQRPFGNFTLLGPLQVGIIFCILLTAFQIGLFGPLHAMVGPVLTFQSYVAYRLIICVGTYFFLSLFFCTISAIFQVDFTLAFGRGGFVVYWMSTWLFMMAVGGANEAVISVIFAYFPQYLGFWLMTWIILNIAPSFFPMVFNNQFYRYGYAMPVHNAVDIYKVIFLDLSKHKMGRNYGILIAWAALNLILLPLAMKIVVTKYANDAKKLKLQEK